MNRLREFAAVGGLSAGMILAGGCGESSIEQDARINGFGQGIDVEVIEPTWLGYTDEEYMPSGNVRYLDDYDVLVDCVAEYDEMFSWNLDDEECDGGWGNFGDIGYNCMSTRADDEHCVAVYEKRYSFQRLEDIVVRECIAPIVKGEYKSKTVAEDESCENQLEPGQRVEKTGRYVLWVSTPNPDQEKGPKTISGTINISAEEWSLADRAEPVTVTISDGRITGGSVTNKG